MTGRDRSRLDRPRGLRRAWLRAGLGAGLALTLPSTAAAAAAGDDRWRERVMQGLGTTLWLRAAGDDRARTDRALDAAVRAIRRVERVMNLFDPSSELSRLNRDGVLPDPDPWLLEVLGLALSVAAASDGAFDPTVQPLWNAWESARRGHTRLTPAQIRQARSRVDWRAVEIGPRRIRFTRAGTALTLNGIAQGFAADVATRELRDAGIEHALIDAGEWSVLGHAPGGGPWTLALADPADSARIAGRLQPGDGRSVATSMGSAHPFTDDGTMHHILDPRTGVSPTAWRAITVLASSCALADALTKVFYTAPHDRHAVLLERWRHDPPAGTGGSPIDLVSIDAAGRLRASAGVLVDPVDGPGRAGSGERS